MTPKEIIALRGKLYAEGDYAGVYELYSENCELREFFRRAEDYADHVCQHHRPGHEFKSVTIHAERVRGSLAEVSHTANFIENGSAVAYNGRSFLKCENGDWKIFKEEWDMNLWD